MEKTSTEVWLEKDFFSPPESPRNSLSSCCYSLLAPVNVLRHPDARLRFIIRFLAFFKGVLFRLLKGSVSVS
jgi:hypothetical protein